MKTVCAESVLHGRALFETLGEVVVFPDEQIAAETVRDADALVIRSKTRVREGLFEGSRTQIVGTATAGIDHLDLQYLQHRNIAFTAAVGCNANSVAEYVMAALLMLVERHGMLVPDLTLGVIGVGQVGSRVVEKAAALGMKVLQNDPPRRLQEGLPELLDLDQVLMESDMITLHVPLIRDGPFRTEHLADHRFFEQLAGGVLFINTSRGEVVDSDALRTALGRGWVLAAALDVWEGEPDLSLDLLEHVEIATPHIAGYSFEGKLSGSTMVYEDVCRFFEVECRRDYASLYPPWEEPCLRLDERGRLAQDVIHQAVQRAYAILDDDERLRAGIRRDADARQSLFRRLRRDYPVRREFGAWKIDSSPLTETLARALAGLGFQLDTEGETR